MQLRNNVQSGLPQIISQLPEEVVSKFYGCGAPLPLGIQGLHVLDLGSGSGRDCYVAAALVGAGGSVTGIDMTDAQNEVRWSLQPRRGSRGRRCLCALDLNSASTWRPLPEQAATE